MSSVKKQFAVVRFTETDSVEAVPLSWIRKVDGFMMCKWPPFKSPTKVTNAICRKEKADDEWEDCEATVIKQFGLFS